MKLKLFEFYFSFTNSVERYIIAVRSIKTSMKYLMSRVTWKFIEKCDKDVFQNIKQFQPGTYFHIFIYMAMLLVKIKYRTLLWTYLHVYTCINMCFKGSNTNNNVWRKGFIVNNRWLAILCHSIIFLRTGNTSHLLIRSPREWYIFFITLCCSTIYTDIRYMRHWMRRPHSVRRIGKFRLT